MAQIGPDGQSPERISPAAQAEAQKLENLQKQGGKALLDELQGLAKNSNPQFIKEVNAQMQVDSATKHLPAMQLSDTYGTSYDNGKPSNFQTIDLSGDGHVYGASANTDTKQTLFTQQDGTVTHYKDGQPSGTSQIPSLDSRGADAAGAIAAALGAVSGRKADDLKRNN